MTEMNAEYEVYVDELWELTEDFFDDAPGVLYELWEQAWPERVIRTLCGEDAAYEVECIDADWLEDYMQVVRDQFSARAADIYAELLLAEDGDD